MTARDPSTRSMVATIGAHAMHAKHDPVATTAAARQAFRDQFLEQAREQFGDLPEPELARRAEHLRKAHYTRLALASAKARAGRKRGTP